MAAKDVATLKNDTQTRMLDNNAGLIVPAGVRSEFFDVIDSCLNKVEPADQSVVAITDFTNGVKSGGFKVFNGAHPALSAESTSTQNPSATDTPLQITFGAAQTNTDISIDAAGKITYHTTGVYFHNTVYRLGRSGSTAAAHAIIAYKLNGNWAGSTTCTLLDTSDEVVIVPLSGYLNMTANDYVEVFVIRDSTGNNDGGLYSFNPTLAGVLNVPSAVTTIWKMSSI